MISVQEIRSIVMKYGYLASTRSTDLGTRNEVNCDEILVKLPSIILVSPQVYDNIKNGS